MATMKKLTLLALCLLMSVVSRAEDFLISNFSIIHDGNYVLVNFIVTVPDYATSESNMLVVTPHLYNESHGVDFVAFVVEGRKMAKRNAQKRTVSGNTIHAKYLNNGSTMVYSSALPYEEWMGGKLSLRLDIEMKNCCNTYDLEPQMIGEVRVDLPFKPIYNGVPNRGALSDAVQTAYPFIRPNSQRNDNGDRGVSVRFHVSQSNIEPDFSTNRETLNKIKEAIELLRANPRTQISGITISGYASPEGELDFNMQLSGDRANALKQYISEQYNISADSIEIVAGGIDWQGLEDLVAKSDMNYKEEVLRIMHEVPENQRNSHLMSIANGRTYIGMLEQLYPQLRDACYINVWYSEGEDFVAPVISQALDKMANREWDAALSLLHTVSKDERSWNDIGVCYMMKGDYTNAEIWLQKAVDAGEDNALQNLNNLRTMGQ